MKTVGIGTRVLNFLADTSIIFLLSYAAYKGWTFYVLLQMSYFPSTTSFATILFLYYLIFETIFSRTLAKWFIYTR